MTWPVWNAFAQETGTGATVEWVQYGVLGLVVVALLTGWLWAKPAVDRVLEENKALRARLDLVQGEILSELRGLRDDLRKDRRDRTT